MQQQWLPHAGERAGNRAMPMTNSESQWLARAFRTIAQIALIEPSNAVDSAANKDLGEQALHATRTLIRLSNEIEGDVRA
jgi:hypothetical protein